MGGREGKAVLRQRLQHKQQQQQQQQQQQEQHSPIIVDGGGVGIGKNNTTTSESENEAIATVARGNVNAVDNVSGNTDVNGKEDGASVSTSTSTSTSVSVEERELRKVVLAKQPPIVVEPVVQRPQMVASPGETDVVVGPSIQGLKHPCNQVYRSLVSCNTRRYRSCESKEKKLRICQSIVAAIKGQEGRFLKLNRTMELWQVIPDSKIIEVTAAILQQEAKEEEEEERKQQEAVEEAATRLAAEEEEERKRAVAVPLAAIQEEEKRQRQEAEQQQQQMEVDSNDAGDIHRNENNDDEGMPNSFHEDVDSASNTDNYGNDGNRTNTNNNGSDGTLESPSSLPSDTGTLKRKIEKDPCLSDLHSEIKKLKSEKAELETQLEAESKSKAEEIAHQQQQHAEENEQQQQQHAKENEQQRIRFSKLETQLKAESKSKAEEITHQQQPHAEEIRELEARNNEVVVKDNRLKTAVTTSTADPAQPSPSPPPIAASANANTSANDIQIKDSFRFQGKDKTRFNTLFNVEMEYVHNQKNGMNQVNFTGIAAMMNCERQKVMSHFYNSGREHEIKIGYI